MDFLRRSAPQPVLRSPPFIKEPLRPRSSAAKKAPSGYPLHPPVPNRKRSPSSARLTGEIFSVRISRTACRISSPGACSARIVISGDGSFSVSSIGSGSAVSCEKAPQIVRREPQNLHRLQHRLRQHQSSQPFRLRLRRHVSSPTAVYYGDIVAYTAGKSKAFSHCLARKKAADGSPRRQLGHHSFRMFAFLR